MSMRYPGGFIASTPVTAAYPSGVWTQAQAIPYQAQNVWTRDQFWPYTTLLLQGDGAVNGAQNNTFLDSSTNNFTITRNGNTTQGAFTPYEQDGYWSNYFGGSSYFSCGASSAFDITSGDFTVEAWVFRTSGGAEQYLFSNRTNSPSSAGWEWRINATDFMSFFFTGGSIVTGSTAVPVNTWTHLAVTRQTNTVRLFVNGVLDTSATFSNGTSASSTGLYVGYGTTGGGYLTGYMSNARLVKGTAVYTSAFTPSAAPLTAITNTSLLTCQSNRFKDNSTNNFTLTIYGTSVQAFQPFPGATTYSGTVLGGSGYFDGSGDFLSLPDNSAFDLNTTFTIDCWFYQSASGTQMLLNRGGGSTDWSNSGHEYILYITSGAMYWQWNSSLTPVNISGGSPAVGSWNHVAVGYNGTTTRVWLNGASIGSSTTGYTLPTTRNITRIGQVVTTENYAWNGYIGQMRIVKGTDVYGVANTTITVPTTPLTAITNTSLLTNFTNAGIFDAAAMNDLETVGNAQVSTSVVKYGTGSMFFNGSGSYLTAPTSPNTGLSTGDFTIEAWVYCTSLSATQTINDARTGNTASAYVFAVFSSGALNFYDGPNNTDRTSSSGVVTINNWAHVAATRSGTTLRLFVNGVIVGTFTGISSDFGSNQPTQIGRQVSGSGIFNGYIDDLRITKGAARYITNFSVPPARFPGQ